MISKGLLEKSLVNIDFISRLLNTEGEDLGLANGIAGQGLAMLQCASLLQFPQLAEKTIIIANKLIYRQNSDGSWFVGDKNATKSGTKLTGLFHGVSGIAYFLLLYAERYYSESAKRSAMKALKWLLKQGHSKDQKPIWPVSNKNQSVDPWLEFGFTGVAFVFIKAYQILGKEAFKNAATSALLSHPRHIISNYLSHGNGLSGLGEAYLEAYEIFGEQEWLDRAILIKDFLMHTTKERYGENGYWLDGSDTLASVDFMSGHAGIVHFLVRLENPKKVKFPILSI